MSLVLLRTRVGQKLKRKEAVSLLLFYSTRFLVLMIVGRKGHQWIFIGQTPPIER